MNSNSPLTSKNRSVRMELIMNNFCSVSISQLWMNTKWLKLLLDINQSQSLSKSFLISCTTRMASTLLKTARYSLLTRPRIPNLIFRMVQKMLTMLFWLSDMVKKKAKNSGTSKTHGLILGAITDISESKEVSTCAVLPNAPHLPLFNLTLSYKLLG